MSKIGKLKTEIEHERKVSIADPARLPNPLPAPRKMVQGYWSSPDADVSLRLIPAEQRAWWRRKSPPHGTARTKDKVEVPYADALPHIYEAPKIAVKDRHVFQDGGREWKLERFSDGHLQAETEDGSKEPLDNLPPWAGKEISGDSSAYSGSRARAMSAPEINAALKEAGSGAEPPKASSPEPAQMSGTLALTMYAENWRPLSWLLLSPSEPDPLGLRKWLAVPSQISLPPWLPSRAGSSLNGASPDLPTVASCHPSATVSGNTLTIIADSQATRLRIMPPSSPGRSYEEPKSPSSRKRYRKQTRPASSGVLAYRRAVLVPAVKVLRACIQAPSPTSTGSIQTASVRGIPSEAM